MTEAIRVLHFADVHIGMENYGKTDAETGLSTRVVDFLRRMDEMVEFARVQDVDLILFAGDAFKTRTPSPTFQREFAWRIRDLSELAPVVMLVGNHDLPPSQLKASSIEIYHTLAVPNVWVADEYEVRRIATKRGDVVVGTAPYPIRARLMTQLPQEMIHTIREADQLLETALGRILEGLAEQADELAGLETPRVLMGHFTVSGARLGSERSVMLGRDFQISLGTLADPRWDYVALGHIHQHQNLSAGREGVPPVVYSGSLERIDFGEEGQPKGFVWLELGRGRADWRYVEVQARPMVTLYVDCREDLHPTRTVAAQIQQHDLRDAIVRLRVQLSPQSDKLLNEGALRDALRQAGAFQLAALIREVDRPERSRLASSPEGLTHLEALEQYFVHMNFPEARRSQLLEAAEPILREDAPLDAE